MVDTELLEKLEKYAASLKNATKKADKVTVLLSAKSDNDLLSFLCFALDTRTVTGLSKVKISKQVNAVATSGPERFFEVCSYLMAHNTGTDYDIATVQRYIGMNANFKDFLISVFTKDLPLGVEAKTVNKVLGMELIHDWQVQQAHSIDKVRLKNREWFSLSQKLNGNRGTYFQGEMISRQGIPFKNLDHIIKDIQYLLNIISNGDPYYVLDGEIIRKNNDGKSDNENFTIGTGVLNSDAADKSCLEFIIFDIVPEDEFLSGESKLTYQSRLLQLEALEKHIQQFGLKNISVVKRFYQGTDTVQIWNWLDYAVSNNMEGLMLNRDTTYRCTRHNGILKVKRFYTMDLKVIGVEEGSGRLKGTLGAIVVDYKGNEVRVGSGFDDATRNTVWKNKDDYIDTIACVKYKEISRDKKTGQESLQFPIFVMFRDDKMEEDISFD